MKLYLLSQSVNNEYDTYDSCVVAAESEEEAKLIHPNGFGTMPNDGKYDSWVRTVGEVECKYIGEAGEGIEQGVICASFNAG